MKAALRVAPLLLAALPISVCADPLFVTPYRSYATGANPYAVAIGDLNADGRPDLAVANFEGNSVSVWLGVGDGTFVSRRDFPTGRGPNSVAIGDLNGDGKPDLALANEGHSTVSVLLGYGNGSFAPRRDFGQTGTNPHSVVIADLNGDGRPDMAVSSGGGISLLLGNRDGTFGPSVNLFVNGGGFSVAAGDLNADGIPDLATANYGGYPDYHGSVSVLLAGGGPWYPRRWLYPMWGQPNGVAIGDLNGDRKPDLAVSSLVGAVSVLPGNGDGTFGEASNYGTGFLPVFVAIGDLNADDREDLAVASDGSGTISVHLGNGDGTFAPRSDYGRWWRPHCVAIADLNGDGWNDMAVADITSSTVTVLLNRGAPPIEIAFDFTPETLIVGHGGRWATGYLEPAPPLAAGDIDISSIRLNGIVPVDPGAPTALGDHDGDEVTDLMVKFDRTAVEATLSEGLSVPVTVTGTAGGQSFFGADTIRILRGGPSRPRASDNPGANEVLAVGAEAGVADPAPARLAIRCTAVGPGAGGRLRVELTLEDGSPARLELIDVAGRAVASRQVAAMGPGRHSLDLPADRALPPGIYLLRLTQGGREILARAAVLK